MGKKWPIPGILISSFFDSQFIVRGQCALCSDKTYMPFRLSRATWKKSKNFFSKWDKLLEQQQPVSNYSSSIHFVWRSCAVWSLVCVVWSVNSALWRYMLYSVHYKNCQVRVVPLPLATGENSHNRWSGLPFCFTPSSPDYHHPHPVFSTSFLISQVFWGLLVPGLSTLTLLSERNSLFQMNMSQKFQRFTDVLWHL